MGVRLLKCGEFVNESERTAAERLRNKLQGANGTWILLSNLNHSSHPTLRSDEIDLVAVGPTGVYVIEIKHWDAAWLRQRAGTAEQEAERINTKAKRVAGKLRQRFEPGFVSARLLLTRGEVRFDAGKRPQLRGVPVFGLPEWSELLAVGGSSQLTPQQVDMAAKLLEPATKLALSGDLRTFAGLINLERVSDKADVFHRVYRGQHPTRRDRVLLHLYDLSAIPDKQSEDFARREFETIQQWQKSPHVPSLLDSFQEAEGYPGELCFFSLVDSAAPSLMQRSQDSSWDFTARLAFASAALSALQQFHQPIEPDVPPLLHRRITPNTLRVRHNGQPLFTDFSLSRLENAQTISLAPVDLGGIEPYIAPEVQTGGLAAATTRTDIYALCFSLATLFDDADPRGHEVRTFLLQGCDQNPEERPTPAELITALDVLHGATALVDSLPAAEYWDEDTVVPFQHSRYKIVDRLGQGGIGRTFKVVELDVHSDEKFGTYVAKLIRHREDGEIAIRAYKKVRAYTTHPHLSTIHEIAPEWTENRFVALMKWVEGMPLQDLIGVLPIQADDLGEHSSEDLALRWLIDLCDALAELHRVGLVHGDVSPRNIIVQGGAVVLTDYDTVTEAGSAPRGGCPAYASPAVQNRTVIQPTDDIYSLASSFFHVLYDRDPFVHGPELRKDHGLNWNELTGYDRLRPFFDKATHQLPQERFPDALSTRQYLLGLETKSDQTIIPAIEEPITHLTPNTVPWLKNLLSAYPGSRHGNSETRGLDTEFATATYVETHLDAALLEKIEAGQVNLVILFGNAGDGKTAFLQYLAKRLGVDTVHSSQRIWEHPLANGKWLRINLDGAAAWQDKSANRLLDDFFRPFQKPDYSRHNIHIVAINNGKLLEWIESQTEDTYLTEQLREVLMGKAIELDPGYCLIDLNQRSLVGGIDLGAHQLGTAFLDTLIGRLLGDGLDRWQDCTTCSAQNRCAAWHSVCTLRDEEIGPRMRARLTDALQACHQRGEVHITARELRAALSYIFFGVHYCTELHNDPDLRPLAYYQRAFDAHSPHRQGELLGELARFDPALEADAGLDRELLKSAPPGEDRLGQARRRAYFERSWVSDIPAITLATGRYLDRFRNVPMMDKAERDELCHDLCWGIAHLEDLPPAAFQPEHMERGVPLRITPRTPAESAFWVVKLWSRFNLQAPLPHTAEGLEALHTHLRLEYRYAEGSTEVLRLGLELFHLLLELKNGVQLSGIAQEGTFANLEIFTQRLAREDPRELYGWHPADEDRVFRLWVDARDGRQVLTRETT